MTDNLLQPDAAPAKVDPESLVLRAKPSPVIRFRRGAIIAFAGASATAIAAACWLALSSTGSSASDEMEDRAPVAAKAASDVLAGAPKDYREVPQLGPALPGDLGRPILERQRELADEGFADPEAAAAAGRAAQQAEAERQRLAAEQLAARESSVMVQVGNTARQQNTVGTAFSSGSSGSQAGAPVGASDSNGQQAKNGLSAPAVGEGGINSHRLEGPASPWTLHAGSAIAASLITGINSDLPGLVTAQVTENAYDSVTGRTLLIPQGSRLIGIYDNVVAFGQSRALVVWQRIVFPDGSSIRIDNVPATDAQGYAGLSDRIDRHTWQLLKGVALSTLLGVGTELGFGNNESDLVTALREATQQNAARAGDQIVKQNLDIQPTLKIRSGWPLRIVVHKDIILRPWQSARS